MYTLLILLSSPNQLPDLWIVSLPSVGAAQAHNWESFALLFLAALAVLGALLAWFWTNRQA